MSYVTSHVIYYWIRPLQVAEGRKLRVFGEQLSNSRAVVVDHECQGFVRVYASDVVVYYLSNNSFINFVWKSILVFMIHQMDFIVWRGMTLVGN